MPHDWDADSDFDFDDEDENDSFLNVLAELAKAPKVDLDWTSQASGQPPKATSRFDLMRLSEGDTIETSEGNTFEILSRLGEGGMGVVYLARHLETGQKVALKTVRTLHQGGLASIRREIRALARLDHPGIVEIVAHGVHAGLPWYAMEYLEGLPLRELFTAADTVGTLPTLGAATVAELPRGTLDAKQLTSPDPFLETHDTLPPPDDLALRHWQPAVEIVQRLCEVLAYLHGEGLVHGDLKPENALVMSDGTVSLVDFGLAMYTRGGMGREKMTGRFTMSGTLLYMAPEQIEGRWLDARADLYAVGCMLFEALTGSPPFLGENTSQILYGHLERTPRFPHTFNIPAPLRDLTLSLLAKRADARPGYAEDVARQLAHYTQRPLQLPSSPRAHLFRPRLTGDAPLRLETLHRHLDALLDGEGAFVLVGGEGGSGKTRMLIELIQTASPRKCEVVIGECVSTGARISLQPLHTAIQSLADRCREHGRDATDAFFGREGRILAAFFPELDGLPGMDAHPPPVELEPDEAKLRVFVALLRVLERWSAEQPLLLLLDDLQWADPLTLEFLHFLAGGALHTPSPITLVATFRTEERGDTLRGLVEHPRTEVLELARLDPRGVSDMVTSMLALSEPPDTFVDFLYAQSEGNPFFVAEYLRTAVAEGLLSRDEQGRWSLLEKGRDANHLQSALSLPGVLYELIQRRLTPLSPRARKLVEFVSVFGREISLELVSGSLTALLDALDDLIDHEVLELTLHNSLRFVHRLIRQVVYDALTADARRTWHRVAAEILEQADTAGLRYAERGHHWELAGHLENARNAYVIAIRNAASTFALHEAERLCRRYLAIVEEPTRESVQISHQLAEILFQTGRTTQARTQAEDTHQAARDLGFDVELGESLLLLASVYRDLKDTDRVLTLLDEAGEHIRSHGDPQAEGRYLSRKGTLLRKLDRYDEARATFEHALTLHRATGDRRLEGVALDGIASTYQRQQQPERALATFEQALAIHRDTGNRRSEGITLNNLAIVNYLLGNHAQARTLYHDTLAIHREVGNRRSEAVALTNLALIELDAGHLDDARDQFEEALAIHREVGNRRAVASTLTNLGLVLLEQAHFDDARDTLLDALERHRAHHNRAHEGVTLEFLARCNLGLGELETAQQHFQTAITTIEEAGLDHFVGQALVSWARLERLLGHLDAARAHLDTAQPSQTGSVYEAHLLTARGHLELASGNLDIEALLQEIHRLLQHYNVLPDSGLHHAVRRLERAALLLTSQRSKLCHAGEPLDDLPPLLRQALASRDLLPS